MTPSNDADRNAMIEHVLSEASFEVERRAAATIELASTELRQKESAIAALAEANAI